MPRACTTGLDSKDRAAALNACYQPVGEDRSRARFECEKWTLLAARYASSTEFDMALRCISGSRHLRWQKQFDLRSLKFEPGNQGWFLVGENWATHSLRARFAALTRALVASGALCFCWHSSTSGCERCVIMSRILSAVLRRSSPCKWRKR